jgi:hypothetical protein
MLSYRVIALEKRKKVLYNMKKVKIGEIYEQKMGMLSNG